jgi:signal transduction histidine kinase
MGTAMQILKVLIVEDRPDDAELMVYELQRVGITPSWERVDNEASYLEGLDALPDVILSDYSLPEFGAMRALRLLQIRQLDIPFIVITGSISEEVAVDCIKQGATDYLLKDRLRRLGAAVMQALDERRLRIEKRRAETELIKSELRRLELEKEKEFVELRERFISLVSHEFRSPLAVMYSSTQLLQRYADRIAPEKRVKYIKDIENQIRYMNGLLDDMLILGKAKAGKIEFDPTPHDLEAFCHDILEQIQVTDQVGHRFLYNVQGELHEVLVDERLLRHILVNLLSNAVKYSPAGTTVRLEITRQGHEGIFRVSDTGIGIPEEDQKRLFEPFHRAGNARDIDGTGLGLTIVKQAVEVHKGTIICESATGVGTTFIVNLPIERASAPV